MAGTDTWTCVCRLGEQPCSSSWLSVQMFICICLYVYIYLYMYIFIYIHTLWIFVFWMTHLFWFLEVRKTPFKKKIIITSDRLCHKRKTTGSALGVLGVKELSSTFADQVGFWRKVGNVHPICFLPLSVLGNHNWSVKDELLHCSNIYLLYCITLMVLILHYTSYY